MNDHGHHPDRLDRDDRIERDLDAWWDAEGAARPHPSTVIDLRAESETIRALHADDSAAGPTPAFAATLREEIMNHAKTLPIENGPTAPWPQSVRRKAVALVPPASWRERVRPWPNRRGLALAEIAAAVLLILASAGLALGESPRSAFNAVFHTASGPDAPMTHAALLAPTVSTPTAAPKNPDAGGMDRGDAARTGAMPGPGPSGAPKLAWKLQGNRDQTSSDALYSSGTHPVVSGGRLFLDRDFTSNADGTTSHVLAALDVKTGADLWTATLTGDSGRYAPAVADGLVFAVTPYGLVAFDETTGALAWSYPSAEIVRSDALAVAGGLVYFTADDGSLRAVEAQSGSERWRTTIPGSDSQKFGSQAPVAVADGIAYAVGYDGIVLAADAKTGRQLWTFQPEGGVQRAPMVADGVIFVASIVNEQGPAGTPGRLYALDARSGTQRWKPLVVASSFEMAAGHGAVYLSSATPDGAPLSAFDIQTGRPLWTSAILMSLSAPNYVDGTLYLTGEDGRTQGIDAKTGKPVWSVYLDGVGDPIIVDGLLIAVGYDTVYAVSGSNAKIIEPAGAAADLSGIAPCVPPRAAPSGPIAGTPATTITAETKLQTREGKPLTWEDGRPVNNTEWPQILAANVPTGPAATDAQVTGIKETFRAMAPCSRRLGADRLLQGYFTDDFFRRGVAAARPDGYAMGWPYQPEEAELADLTATVLDDGRVAAAINHGARTLTIFVQRDGQWLIDELYVIVDQYNFGPQG
ncbi:MAG: PQQ-binding-like beta-propeller repeat protein [Thermomicrobiales bacterium]